MPALRRCVYVSSVAEQHIAFARYGACPLKWLSSHQIDQRRHSRMTEPFIDAVIVTLQMFDIKIRERLLEKIFCVHVIPIGWATSAIFDLLRADNLARRIVHWA